MEVSTKIREMFSTFSEFDEVIQSFNMTETGKYRWFLIKMQMPEKSTKVGFEAGSLIGLLTQTLNVAINVKKWWIVTKDEEIIVFLNTGTKTIKGISNLIPHGFDNLQAGTIRNRKDIENYLNKCILNGCVGFYKKSSEVIKKSSEYFYKLNKASSTKSIECALGSLNIIDQEQSQAGSLSLKSLIESTESLYNDFESDKKYKSNYKLSDFIWPAISQEILYNYSVHLYGPSRVGITSFAEAHFENFLFVSNNMGGIEKIISGFHDGIIFDDVNFTKMSPEEVKTIVDIKRQRTLGKRYGSITIPAGTRRIFTSNREDIWYLPRISGADKQAIDNLIQVIHIKTPLYKTDLYDVSDAKPEKIIFDGVQLQD